MIFHKIIIESSFKGGGEILKQQFSVIPSMQRDFTNANEYVICEIKKGSDAVMSRESAITGSDDVYRNEIYRTPRLRTRRVENTASRASRSLSNDGAPAEL